VSLGNSQLNTDCEVKSAAPSTEDVTSALLSMDVEVSDDSHASLVGFTSGVVAVEEVQVSLPLQCAANEIVDDSIEVCLMLWECYWNFIMDSFLKSAFIF
jgi:hypothetical protein